MLNFLSFYENLVNMLQSVLTKVVKANLRPVIIRNYDPIVIKDLHKMYQHDMKKYEEEDKKNILKFFNNAKSVQDIEVCVPKNKAGKVFQYLSKNSPIEVIEQLLDIKGIEVKHLEKFCDKILLDPEKDGVQSLKKQILKLKSQTVPQTQLESTSYLDIGLFHFRGVH